MGVIVAIDGPAGAGKSTIAKRVAQVLGFAHVDTGAIYRAVTLASLERGLTDEHEIAALLGSLAFRFQGSRVLVGDRDVTSEIRTPRVTSEVSRVSAYGSVRGGLLELQRSLGRADPRGAVLEGRDIGTVVFPDADVKIFLTASPEERARRRLKDLEDAGEVLDREEVLRAILARDALDSGRSVAPLRRAADAVEVDSTAKSMDEVVEEIVGSVRSVRAALFNAPG